MRERQIVINNNSLRWIYISRSPEPVNSPGQVTQIKRHTVRLPRESGALDQSRELSNGRNEPLFFMCLQVSKLSIA